jgi:hypothetical protein
MSRLAVHRTETEEGTIEMFRTHQSVSDLFHCHHYSLRISLSLVVSGGCYALVGQSPHPIMRQVCILQKR